MGTAESRELVFRWKASWARAAPAGAAVTGPSPSTGQEPARPWPPPRGSSGPTAPCRGNSPPLSSISRVGDAGGDTRGFRLVEAPDSNFNNPFFSFLLSLSGLLAEPLPQADEEPSGDVGSPGRMVTVRPLGSASREAAVMLGEVSEVAAAQASGAPARLIPTAAAWAAEPAIGGRGCGEASEWWGRPTDEGPRQAAFCTWMGVTAAVGRSWLCAATVLTALRAWLTVICPVMCNRTFV